MHTSANITGEALQIVRRHWQGPLGAYPDSGFFKMPDWQFVDIIPPEDLSAKCREWQQHGATIFGGCCGIGAAHISHLYSALLG
jgi:homocysteine S-methyltransferase